jgi:hypothetical protein
LTNWLEKDKKCIIKLLDRELKRECGSLKSTFARSFACNKKKAELLVNDNYKKNYNKKPTILMEEAHDPCAKPITAGFLAHPSSLL